MLTRSGIVENHKRCDITASFSAFVAFPGLNGGFDQSDDPNVFLTIRMWSSKFKRPVSVRDIVVQKATTVNQFK
jgi:hypothetical protein